MIPEPCQPPRECPMLHYRKTLTNVAHADTPTTCTDPSSKSVIAPVAACPMQYTVELTLEEIYFGCLKKVTHKRKVLLDNGEYLEEPRTLTIDVKPGLPSGTRFVFEG